MLEARHFLQQARTRKHDRLPRLLGQGGACNSRCWLQHRPQSAQAESPVSGFLFLATRKDGGRAAMNPGYRGSDGHRREQHFPVSRTGEDRRRPRQCLTAGSLRRDVAFLYAENSNSRIILSRPQILSKLGRPQRHRFSPIGLGQGDCECYYS